MLNSTELKEFAEEIHKLESHRDEINKEIAELQRGIVHKINGVVIGESAMADNGKLTREKVLITLENHGYQTYQALRDNMKKDFPNTRLNGLNTITKSMRRNSKQQIIGA